LPILSKMDRRLVAVAVLICLALLTIALRDHGPTAIFALGATTSLDLQPLSTEAAGQTQRPVVVPSSQSLETDSQSQEAGPGAVVPERIRRFRDTKFFQPKGGFQFAHCREHWSSNRTSDLTDVLAALLPVLSQPPLHNKWMVNGGTLLGAVRSRTMNRFEVDVDISVADEKVYLSLPIQKLLWQQGLIAFRNDLVRICSAKMDALQGKTKLDNRLPWTGRVLPYVDLYLGLSFLPMSIRSGAVKSAVLCKTYALKRKVQGLEVTIRTLAIGPLQVLGPDKISTEQIFECGYGSDWRKPPKKKSKNGIILGRRLLG